MKALARTAALAAILAGAALPSGAHAATLVGDYTFQNTLAPVVGTADALTPIGAAGGAYTSATINGTPQTVYTFPQGAGLRFAAPAALEDYSIVASIRFDQTSGWRRIMDVSNRTSDRGLYFYQGYLQFYPYLTGTTFTAPNTWVEVTLTRTSAGAVHWYLNDNPESTFSDTAAPYFAKITDSVNFFLDDLQVPGEMSAGSVSRIRVFSGVLTEEEVVELPDDPVVINTAPAAATMDAAGANGFEGSELTASGSFTDADGDTLTISGGGVTDNGDGSWSWDHTATDDSSALVVVTASDGEDTATQQFTWTATNADPVLTVAAAGTACDPTLSGSYSDAGTADTHIGTIDWGDGSTDDAFSTSPFGPLGHAYTSAGDYTVTVGVADDDGGTDGETIEHTVNNLPSTVLQPINASGTRSVFKAGSTIPVKITVVDCAGAAVSTLTPTVGLTRVDSTTLESVNEPAVSVVATNGKQMRWDATGRQYIYNLSSKLSQHTGAALGAGTYELAVDDASFASPVRAYFDLKK